jgi:trans-aconitate methyltransferase
MEFTFDNFKERANDKNLSKWEKIGFPDSYRKGFEELIFEDISSKVKIKDANYILDIGCGCSELVEQFMSYENS